MEERESLTPPEITVNASSSVAELCDRHQLSPTTLYREIKAGRLRTFAVGATRRISDQAEREWIALLEERSRDYTPLKIPPKSKATA